MAIELPEVRQRVGQRLRILAPAETLDANDSETIDAGLDAVIAYLYALDIITIDIEDGVELHYVTPLVMMTAAVLVDAFQIPEPRRSVLRDEGLLGLPSASLAERMMRKLVYARGTGEPVSVEYF
jgi:hypothetical protein